MAALQDFLLKINLGGICPHPHPLLAKSRAFLEVRPPKIPCRVEASESLVLYIDHPKLACSCPLNVGANDVA